jgi:hypothetical protein
MPFRNIRPLHILWQDNINLGMLDGVTDGIITTLTLAGVFQEIYIKYLSTRRQPDWRNQDGTLNAYQSLDWHIEQARKSSKVPGQLNGAALLNSLRDDPGHQTEPRYELVVVKELLHCSDASLRKISGLARKGQGAVITLNHHLHLLQPVKGESKEDAEKRRLDYWLSTKMLEMHEDGHVFDLFSLGTDKEDPDDEDLLATHCLNDCVMHFYEDPERDKKVADNPFCTSCLEKLKEFFIEP